MKTTRNYYFDNAKVILIFLVVFGHFIRSFIENDPYVLALYKTLYTFHMPAFIIVSGFFAKGFYKKGYIPKLFKKLIMPYLLFQVIYSIYYYFLYNRNSLTIDIYDPQWSLWFLLSLFCWNILLYLFVRKWNLTRNNALFIAFAVGIAIGFIDSISNYLSLSRTFVLFPLFLLGYYLKKEHFTMLRSNRVRIASAVIPAAVFIFMISVPEFSDKWLLGSKSYEQLGGKDIFSPLSRSGVYLLNIIMAFSFFSFVPKSRHFFTKWGASTLYVYLIHGFFVKFFRESPYTDLLPPIQSIFLLTAASFILTILLSSRPLTSLTQPLIELKTSKLSRLLNDLKNNKKKYTEDMKY
ncbi:acyltransferase family protein [Rossellomorea vietnamensis]|uniref:Acyltransferase family protein n=1 Tax=Rossellomorea vietnamensis TaxID=218284 RepID=A0A5D4NQE5_9BACI|nr:acyltransferase family protein [Rossellomorea vietnamensis]TYS15771.1 acyltransferase family protein [Rossellomorea vietnamensis]